MADVFISYASEDRNRVRPLAEALQARGFDVWWDRALAAGQDYASVIERELRSAKAVVVVWTAGSAASTFVRDEAGRARDEGRLIPVLLDRVAIPLGFGAFQAEDFTNWNGGANAPQMQILEEALKAKIQGRDVDGGAVARKRRKLMARIRIVSLLTVVALVVGIAAFGKYLFDPPGPQVVQTDIRGELLRLLAEGKLTPEQAIQLAEILESGALGEQTQMAEQAPARGAPGVSTRSVDGDVQLASVSEAEFDAASREAWRQAFTDLSQHPDAQVRLATAQMAGPDTRQAAMQTLWTYAQNNPNDPLREKIYLLCGTVGEQNADPLGQRALEVAATLQPADQDVWRMLSRSYRRTDRPEEAEAAAIVVSAAEAQQEGETAVAEQRLQEALPNLRTPATRAIVAATLGDMAEQRQDFTSASARFAEATRAIEQVAESAPQSTIAENLEVVVQRQVTALDRSGRLREACQTLQEAQVEHDVRAPDADLLARCERLRVQLRPQVLDRRQQLRTAPALRPPPPPPAP